MIRKIAALCTILLTMSPLGLIAQNNFKLSLGTSIGVVNVDNTNTSFNRWYFNDGPTFQYGSYFGGSYEFNKVWSMKTNFTFFKRSASGLKVKDNFNDPTAIASGIYVTTIPSYSYLGAYENWFLDVPLTVGFSPFQNKKDSLYSVYIAAGPNFLFNLRRIQTLEPVNLVDPIQEIKNNKIWLKTGGVISLGLSRKIGDRYGVTSEILGKVYDFRGFEFYYGINLGGWISL